MAVSIYRVGQVIAYVKNMFTQDYLLSGVHIRGEVSNCKYHPSGHIYFTLKDSDGALPAVMFAGNRKGLKFILQEGQSIVITGSVNIYERDGRCQIYAKEIALDGRGSLYEEYERLKKELEERGLFASEYKQPIPRYVRKLGIVTAPGGAAVRDIINISARRNPYVQLYLYPALVQGEGAAASIVRGIETLDRLGLDCLIVGRGGGSIEDLWAFNEEIVAQAVFDCYTPVISAVGHETDFTIVDFVSDLRAPTPSAAAELAVFDICLFTEQLQASKRRLRQLMMLNIQHKKQQLSQFRLMAASFHPALRLASKRQYLDECQDKMVLLMNKRLAEEKHRLAIVAEKLNGLSPLKKLCNGYVFATDERGDRLRTVEQTAKGERIFVRLADGRIEARIEKTERK